ncbi:TlpA disulfide reductase family protein [Prevotella sp. KH2C16]|uniref:TlpA disulfide reductase family protein n=1 Tax=Prevotella sp. KH2C16 TaxID=1855325 RepID=UPI0008EC48FB|nr:TlpA disulfide reductase family protein [Prevotella sp. KH2C16]SFG26827.1 Peroxiredoxin [Prevotella sp. KH2C16]
MKQFLLVLFSLLSATATAQDFRLHASLNTRECDGVYIYLVKAGVADPRYQEKVDSAKIAGGQFCFALPAPAEPYLARLVLPEKAFHENYAVPDLQVIVEPGYITLDYDDFKTILKGGVLNEELGRILRHENDIRDSAMALNRQRDAYEKAHGYSDAYNGQLNARLQKLWQAVRPDYYSFIRGNIRNEVGAAFFYSFGEDYYPRELYQELSAAVSPVYRERYEARMAAARKREEETVAARNATRAGARFRDFSSKTADGKAVRFSDFVKGKAVLLDFWASWCVPCRQEIPFVKELYRKYHDRGFNVVSVSLDQNRAAWLKAVDKEHMPWPQWSTVEGFDCEAARAYAVQAIPFVVLMDGKGNIVQVNLHGATLEKAVKALAEVP